MATKYILNSGAMQQNLDRTREYYLELLKGLGDSPNLLVCPFAQPREVWESDFENRKQSIFDLIGDTVLPKIELAMPSTFIEQVKKADAIHIPGGDDHLVQYWLSKFELKKLFEGKSVGGSSAGANALVVASWTCDWRECIDGLGLVDVAFISHYNSKAYAENDPRGPIDWNAAKKSLKAYASDLPVYSPVEADFVIINT